MLTHKGTPVLKTERLILRPFKVSDYSDMYNNWVSDPLVTKFLSWEPYKSPDSAKETLTAWCEGYKDPKTYNWAIEIDGNVIGSLSVITIHDRHEYAELGYCMSRAYWNNGIMTEAVSAVVDYLFGEIGVNSVRISHAVKNPGSGRVAQKCGFTLEGTRREAFKSSFGEFLDTNLYAILRSEWEEQRRK